MNAIPAIKFIGAWVCIIAAIVLLVLAHQPVAVPIVLVLMSVAFSQAPTTW